MNLIYTRKEVEGWVKEILAHTDEGPTAMAHYITMSVPVAVDGDVETWEGNGKEYLIHNLREIVANYGKKRLARVFHNDLGKNAIVAEDRFIHAILQLLF